MAQASEQKLLEELKHGDRSALGRLLELHQQRVFNVCYRMVSNRDDAAELCQETMLKVIQHIDSYNNQCALSTWMIRIAINLSISHLRKRKLRQTASLEAQAAGHEGESGVSLREQLADVREPGPEKSVQTKEMLHHLQNVLSELEEDLRAVLVLRDIDQMDYQQIAVALVVPVGTVKSRLFRARLALRHEMMKLYPAQDKSAPSSKGAASA